MKAQIYNDIDISKETTTEIIYENTEQNLEFNVMPLKQVNEKLFINKYIVDKNKIQAFFNRKYETEMVKSPDHFIFLSALINLQKMIYILMCKYLNIKYEPFESEKLKIWPIKTNVEASSCSPTWVALSYSGRYFIPSRASIGNSSKSVNSQAPE